MLANAQENYIIKENCILLNIISIGICRFTLCKYDYCKNIIYKVHGFFANDFFCFVFVVKCTFELRLLLGLQPEIPPDTYFTGEMF